MALTSPTPASVSLVRQSLARYRSFARILSCVLKYGLFQRKFIISVESNFYRKSFLERWLNSVIVQMPGPAPTGSASVLGTLDPGGQRNAMLVPHTHSFRPVTRRTCTFATRCRPVDVRKPFDISYNGNVIQSARRYCALPNVMRQHNCTTDHNSSFHCTLIFLNDQQWASRFSTLLCPLLHLHFDETNRGLFWKVTAPNVT